MSAAEEKRTPEPEPGPEEVALRREFRVPVVDAVVAYLVREGRRRRVRLADLSYSGAFLVLDPGIFGLSRGRPVRVSFESRSKRRCSVSMVVRHVSDGGVGLELSPTAERDAVQSLRAIVNEAQRDFIRTQIT